MKPLSRFAFLTLFTAAIFMACAAPAARAQEGAVMSFAVTAYCFDEEAVQRIFGPSRTAPEHFEALFALQVEKGRCAYAPEGVIIVPVDWVTHRLVGLDAFILLRGQIPGPRPLVWSWAPIRASGIGFERGPPDDEALAPVCPLPEEEA